MATAVPVVAAPVKVEPKDASVLEQFLIHARAEAKAMTPEHVKSVTTPETFCWVDFPKLSESLTAFELTENPDHLRDFVAGFEPFRAALTKGPEGLLGWYGKPIPPLVDPAKPDVQTCEIQDEFRAIGMLARFIVLANANEFNNVRESYRALIEDQLMKKWDSYYVDLGAKGATYRWNKDYIPTKSLITLPHEKQAIIIEGLLAASRAIGNPACRTRAEKLGVFLKSSMTVKDDHYVWNYWTPAGDWDYVNGKARHWENVEPKGMWYSVTVASAVMLYDNNLVFDESDMQKLVATQMKVCWNSDLEKPEYAMVNGAKPGEKDKNERFICPALARWEPKLATLIYSGAYQNERIKKAADPWQGGVLAAGWLRGKYIELPAGQGGKRLYPATQPAAK